MTINLYYDRYDAQTIPKVRVANRDLLNSADCSFVLYKKDDEKYREVYSSVEDLAKHVALIYSKHERKEEVTLHRGPWVDFMKAFVCIPDGIHGNHQSAITVKNAFSNEDDLIKIRDCLVNLIALG